MNLTGIKRSGSIKLNMYLNVHMGSETKCGTDYNFIFDNMERCDMYSAVPL